MKNERDKFLTESMGFAYSVNYTYNQENGFDFSTWEGFGNLWEWCRSQQWWTDFFSCRTRMKYIGFLHQDYINPDRFADAIYAFLSERDKP